MWTDIYVQEFATDYLGFENDGVSIGIGVHNQSNPQIQLLTQPSENSELSYLVFWDDFRSSGKEWYRNIFAQRVVLEGELSNNEFTVTPSGYALYNNYPNPFNPSTTISFDVPEISHIDLIVYDINGREIKRLVSGSYVAENYSVVWNGTDASGNKVSSGIYFAVLQSDNIRLEEKMILIK